MADIKYYRELKERLLAQDKYRDRAFDFYTRVYHNEWQLPDGLASYDFFQKYTDHSPHDAVRAGINVLSSLPPKPRIIPSKGDELQKQQANEWERVLKWQLMSANRRRPVSVESDVATSAILYLAVAMMVVDLDWQINQMQGMNVDTRRMQSLRRYGRFMVNTYNPRDLHVLRSSYGVEQVLLCQRKIASEVQFEWGDHGKVLKELADKGDVVAYYDHMGYDERCVWVEKDDKSEPIVIVPPSPHGLPFMPWVAMMGGSTLESEPAHQYHPMLYPLYTTGEWDMLNALESLAFTAPIIQAFEKPLIVTQGEVEEDYTDPSPFATATPGTVVQNVGRTQLDQSKMELVRYLLGNIERATVPNILQGGGNNVETFATLNLKTQTAMGMLAPAKSLMENALAEMFTLFLLWTAHTGTPMTAQGTDKRKDLGEIYTIESDEIDTDNLYITVSVDPKVPTDRMQQLNAANLAVALGYSKESALEDVGVDDPQEEMRKSTREQIFEFVVQQGLQAMAMAQEQAGQEAMLAQQEEAQAAAEAEAMQGPIMGGQGFNPAMGGTPPAVAAPTYTREDVTGEDLMGNEVMV